MNNLINIDEGAIGFLDDSPSLLKWSVSGRTTVLLYSNGQLVGQLYPKGSKMVFTNYLLIKLCLIN